MSKKRERKKLRDVPLLVKEENISTTLEKSMCSRKASKTAANYDDLNH